MLLSPIVSGTLLTSVTDCSSPSVPGKPLIQRVFNTILPDTVIIDKSQCLRGKLAFWIDTLLTLPEIRDLSSFRASLVRLACA